MTLHEYLSLKYQGTNWSLSRLEAEAFGIDYPLIGGWIDTYVYDITREKLVNLSNKLEKSMDGKKKTSSQKTYDFISILLRK
jgi:hypothetical protein